MADVVVVGSINMDTVIQLERLPKPGETVHAEEMLKFPGGKGLNQATALARLGDRVRFIGKVGDDEDGRVLQIRLKEEGIDIELLHSCNSKRTGSAIILVDKNGNNEIVVIKGANTEVDFQDMDQQERLFHQAKFLLMQFEIPLDTVKYMVGLAKSYQVPVVLNPSPFYPIIQDLLQDIDYLILNEQEATLLLGQKIETLDDAQNALIAIHKLSSQVVIMTLGEHGAISCDKTGRVTHTPAFPIHPVDTTASGDAFLGGLIHGLLAGKTIEESVFLANAVGAVTALRLGAQSSLPRIEEVEAFISNQQQQKV